MVGDATIQELAFIKACRELEDAENIKRFQETHICHTCSCCEEPGNDYYGKIGWCTDLDCFVDPMKSPAQVDCENMEGF